ncbi:MAG: hypothetical protein PVI90_18290 [Desulfobacteraceae bacterium]
MKKVSIIIKNKSSHYEGLRSSLGLLLEDAFVQMFVIGDEIEMHEAYWENLGFFEEMGGHFFSNNPANVKKYGFRYMDYKQIAEHMNTSDVVIPF